MVDSAVRERAGKAAPMNVGTSTMASAVLVMRLVDAGVAAAAWPACRAAGAVIVAVCCLGGFLSVSILVRFCLW